MPLLLFLCAPPFYQQTDIFWRDYTTEELFGAVLDKISGRMIPSVPKRFYCRAIKFGHRDTKINFGNCSGTILRQRNSYIGFESDIGIVMLSTWASEIISFWQRNVVFMSRKSNSNSILACFWERWSLPLEQKSLHTQLLLLGNKYCNYTHTSVTQL